jgi:hypothetical protein
METQLVANVMRSLLTQARVFGLFGSCLNFVRGDGDLVDAEGRRLWSAGDCIDLDRLNLPENPKAQVKALRERERRLDISDVRWFTRTRLTACQPIIVLADRAKLSLDPDFPLLYNTVNWPADRPPAGKVSDVADFRIEDGLQSLTAMWSLQLNRPHGQEIATLSSSLKIIRAALWVVQEKGFLAALDYIFCLIDHGFIIEPDVVVYVFMFLFARRRQASSDTELIANVLPTGPDDPGAWIGAKIKIPPAGPFIRQLSDDAELAIHHVEQQAKAARLSADMDGWLVNYARLGLAARATYSALRAAGLEKDLVFAPYSAQYEEYWCDIGPFFQSYLEKPDAPDYGERLKARWSMAQSLAIIGKKKDRKWLDYILSQRVVLPDALESKFKESPFNFDADVDLKWVKASEDLSIILGRLSFRDDNFQVRCALGTNTQTQRLVSGALEALKFTDVEQVSRIASMVWPLFIREARAGEPPYETDEEILQNFVLLLAVHLAKSRADVIRWLDEVQLELSLSEVDAERQSVIAPAVDVPANLLRLQRLVSRYPLNPRVYVALALVLKEDRQIELAWEFILRALRLDPSSDVPWRAAELILMGLNEEDAKVAFGMSEVLTLFREKGVPEEV